MINFGKGYRAYLTAFPVSLCATRSRGRLGVGKPGHRPLPQDSCAEPWRAAGTRRTRTRVQSERRGGASGRGRGRRKRNRAGGARGGERRARPAQAGEAVARAAAAGGMGDGGAERDRGPAHRAESRDAGRRAGNLGGTEDSRADEGGRSPREVAGTSASSPAGSRESGGDSDGQPGPGEADHCRRILVRGKGTASSPGPPGGTHETPTGVSDLRQHPLSSSCAHSFTIQSFIQRIIF